MPVHTVESWERWLHTQEEWVSRGGQQALTCGFPEQEQVKDTGGPAHQPQVRPAGCSTRFWEPRPSLAPDAQESIHKREARKKQKYLDRKIRKAWPAWLSG